MQYRNYLLIILGAAFLFSPFVLEADSRLFDKKIKPFLNQYCIDCHDDETQKGDVSLHKLTGISEHNADLWLRIWEQVALKEMPPRKKKNQPDLMQRYEISKWITSNLDKVLSSKGGFSIHKFPAKGNHLDHDLLFNTVHENLEPASTPARLWRIHTQEHLVRLNELIAIEPEYDPKFPGKRARGDHIPANPRGDIKLYVGLERAIDLIEGGFEGYSSSVTGYPGVLSSEVKHGLRSYPLKHTVNDSEVTQLVKLAETIVCFIAYGPNASPEQFAESRNKVPKEYLNDKTVRGGPSAMIYGLEPKRPLTPVHDLVKKKNPVEEDVRKAVDYLFEALTLRPPSKKESDEYTNLVKKSIKKAGGEDGAVIGLTSIFFDSNALFRPELCRYEVPDKYGRVMLQGTELMLAVNAAFSYIRPDKELRDSLDEGRLKTREDVKREVIRILNDDSIRKPRILQFFREYFDYGLAPYIDKTLGDTHYIAMNSSVLSTDRLVELILQEDKNVFKELLTTDRAVVHYLSDASNFRNQHEETFSHPVPGSFKTREKLIISNRFGYANFLASDGKPIYVRESKYVTSKSTKNGRAFQNKYPLGVRTLTTVNPKQRCGILTHPSWLVAHSDAMNNHAILRGKWIRERLLGDAIPDVPVTVDAMLPEEPKSTLRHRMRVTREKECWRCHRKIDPLGLPFEMYNHQGFYRELEHRKPVDTSGEILYSGDPALDGPVTNAIDMIKKLAVSERVEQVFVRHVFRFWMGRNETLNDAPVLKAAHKAYKGSGGSMKALLVSLLTSDAFLYRKVERK